MKQKIILIQLILLVVLNTLSYALDAQTKSAWFKIDTTKVKIKPIDTKKILKDELKLQNSIEVRKYSSEKLKTDELNQTHEKYHLYYNGLKIEYSDVRVHYKNDNVIRINGDYVSDVNISIIPKITKETAIDKALEFVGADKYIWEYPAENILLQEKAKERASSFYPQPELVICRNYLSLKDTAYHLAYKMEIYAISPLRRENIYVDATTGVVIGVKPLIETAIGTADTRYSGTRNISTEFNGSTYILRDNSRGNGIVTYNLNNSEFFPDTTHFTDANNNWTSIEYDNAARDNGALDAHWGAMMTYDYFKNEHGRDSYDDEGAQLTVLVHYGTNYPNGFWSSNSSGLGTITLGDGHAAQNGLDMLTSIDWIAHEFGHGVSGNTAKFYLGLPNHVGEPGAISEGLNDIWAACVEEYVNDDKEIWIWGDEVDNSLGGYFSRSLSNPNNNGNPDTYGGDYWISQVGCVGSYSNDWCGQHKNSTVMSHWFYLLAVGGPVTINNNNYNITGIGIESAAKITYRAQDVYMDSNTSFADARVHTIQSAEDWYGVNSKEVSSVIEAWYAVGVGSCTNEILENTTVITSTTLRGCNIGVENVSVTNNSKLFLDAVFETTINGPFEVESGSELEIK